MMYVLVLISIILIIAGLLRLYKIYIVTYCRSKVCFAGKTIIITGGNAGIGYETALHLACRGARVILACRNEQRGLTAVENIKKLTHNDNIVLKLLDLASFTSIRNFAKDIIANEEKVDILINNAGILGDSDCLTEDGLQIAWQSNHFGPVLLTFLLLDMLKKSAPSRIINVSSMTARFSNLSLNSLNKFNGKWMTYFNTKLANIFFTQELSEQLKNNNISVFSLHPGAVATNLMPFKMFGGFLKYLATFMSGFFYFSPEEGCQTTLYCACEKNIEDLTGSHFEYCQVVKPYKAAQNPTLAKQIMEESLKLIKYDKTE